MSGMWKRSDHATTAPHFAFAKHKGGIPAWTKLRTSNGAPEGTDDEVKLLSHRSYGFHNDNR